MHWRHALTALALVAGVAAAPAASQAQTYVAPGGMPLWSGSDESGARPAPNLVERDALTTGTLVEPWPPAAVRDGRGHDGRDGTVRRPIR